MIQFLISCVIVSFGLLLLNINDGYSILFFVFSIVFLISSLTKKTIEKVCLKKIS